MRTCLEWSLVRWAKVALLALVLVAWVAFLRPAPLGGPLSLVMVSGQSMEPTMETGDLAVVFDRGHYEVGNVVAFRPESGATGTSSSMVIHRIVDGGPDSGFATQGDGNDWLDPWDTPANQIAGRMAFFVPNVGHVLAHLRDPVILGALFAAVAAFLVVSRPDPSRRSPDEETGSAWAAGVAP